MENIFFISIFYYSYHFMLPFYVIWNDWRCCSLCNKGNKALTPDHDDENESSIRRACSLSDLSMGKGKRFLCLNYCKSFLVPSMPIFDVLHGHFILTFELISLDFIIKGFNKGAPTAGSKSSKERNTTRNLPKRSASSVGKSATSGMGMRSASVGMLNQAVSCQIDKVKQFLKIIISRATLISQNRLRYEVAFSDRRFHLKTKPTAPQ